MERRSGERSEEIRKIEVICDGTTYEAVLLDLSATALRFVMPTPVAITTGKCIKVCLTDEGVTHQAEDVEVIRVEGFEGGARVAVRRLSSR
jgi:hypothetical protein